MTLVPSGYLPRLIDGVVSECLTSFGAVSIEGPKFCGKTWTALSHANSAVYLHDPSGGFGNRKLALSEPSVLLRGDEPLLLDEWQEVPSLWDAVRHEVDRRRTRGRFLLTGSSTPRGEAPLHSGAGRIARVTMRTMTLFESGESTGTVRVGELLAGKASSASKAALDLEHMAKACARGGWPESLDLPERGALRQARQYLEAIYASDISAADNVQRSPQKAAALIRALARCNATAVTAKTLKWDIYDGANSISSPTLSAYLAALRRIFILQEIPVWTPSIRSKGRMRLSPKRYLTDPSLVVSALGSSPAELLADHSSFGQIFEGLCLRDLAVYAGINDAELLYYRDYNDLEVDAILRRPNGSYAAFEIKLSASMEDVAASTLKKFAARMKSLDVQPPVCMGIITGDGAARQRDDGIIVIPIACLRD